MDRSAATPAARLRLAFDLEAEGRISPAAELEALKRTPSGGTRKVTALPGATLTEVRWGVGGANAVQAFSDGDGLCVLLAGSAGGGTALSFHGGGRVDLPADRRELDAVLGPPLSVHGWGL